MYPAHPAVTGHLRLVANNTRTSARDVGKRGGWLDRLPVVLIHCPPAVNYSGSMGNTSSDPRPQWVLRLEEKHGLPVAKIPGTIYGLCYDPPIIVQSVSLDYAGDPPEHDSRGYLSASPIHHYVGWTQQQDPHRRILRHHSPSTQVSITLGRGTMEREEAIKRDVTCPTCGRPYAESLSR
jgi:hypothetical protein